VVIVAMDDASMQSLGKPLMFFSPELAKVVDYLHDQGAAAIGVDFLLPESEETIDYLGPRGPGNAELMGQAIGRAGNVVLPEWLAAGAKPLYQWQVPSAMPWADLGFVDLSVDSDLTMRRQQLRQTDEQGTVHPSFALALLIKARGLSQQWLSAPELTLDNLPIPLESDSTLPINYVGPAGTIRVVSFRDVLANAGRVRETHRETQESGAFHAPYQDAIVLIGTIATAHQDRYAVPYMSQSLLRLVHPDAGQQPPEMMSGVEVSANVLATLIDGAAITTPWWLSTPLLLIIVGGAMGAVLVRCSLEAGALLAVAHHLAWRGLAAAAFCLGNWRVEMVSMLVLGVLLYGTIFALRWRWIRRMMGMVKSEAVARALEADPRKLDLRGEQREITVLFCDIRDFTPFSERHAPHEVVRLLNEFFTAVVPAIEAEGGTVNLYIGDAVMVIFGAPQAQPDHAVRAVRAALEVVRRVHQLADRWKQLGAERFRIGIGIHTGKAVVGTVGSPRRLDYTAIGDTVNTAARIESANKELHSEVLVSHATFLAVPAEQRGGLAPKWEAKPLSVKGKQETLQVYPIV
jgi:adenylate cyclase